MSKQSKEQGITSELVEDLGLANVRLVDLDLVDDSDEIINLCRRSSPLSSNANRINVAVCPSNVGVILLRHVVGLQSVCEKVPSYLGGSVK